VLERVARRMTDRDETEADAKATVRQEMEDALARREMARAARRPAPQTPEARARQEAEAARRQEIQMWHEASVRRSREEHFLRTLTSFADMRHGSAILNADPQVIPLTDLVALLSPAARQQIPAPLMQAEEVVQTVRDLLAQPPPRKHSPSRVRVGQPQLRPACHRGCGAASSRARSRRCCPWMRSKLPFTRAISASRYGVAPWCAQTAWRAR